MDPNANDPRKALEIEGTLAMGGAQAVYKLGQTDAYLHAIEQFQKIQKVHEARAEAMNVVIDDYTEAVIVIHAVKKWVSENVPEVDPYLWDILMSIDTSSVEV